MPARGFLLGGTAGRTTLNGEGLQHQDGHSHLLASTIPNCIAYDPTFAYELAVIVQDGCERMYAEQEDVFYYITVMNENYAHPAMPEGAEEGILRGHVPAARGGGRRRRSAPRVQLLGSGTILREVLAGGGPAARRTSASPPTSGAPRASPSCAATASTSSAGTGCTRRRKPRRSPTCQRACSRTEGPVVAATDYMRAFADQIRPFVPRRYVVLGTDGFGRSDTPRAAAPASSRSTATTWRWRRSRRSPTRAELEGAEEDAGDEDADREAAPREDDEAPARARERAEARGRDESEEDEEPRKEEKARKEKKEKEKQPEKKRKAEKAEDESEERQAKADEREAREPQRAPSPSDLAPYGTGGRRPAAHAGPSVRRLANELGVDLSLVPGSGRKGRIRAEDVHGYVKALIAQRGGAAVPIAGVHVAGPVEIDFGQWGETTVEPLNRVRRVAAANLHRSWVTVPHVTQFDDADVTELEAFRQDHRAEAEARGTKLTFLPFLVKAVVKALQEFPHFNASLDHTGENLVVKRYYHIGVAVDTEHGLVVPVLRDADRKGLFELAAELQELSERARARRLRPEHLQGGSFSISSLGGIGGTKFTPIVNHPEVAILGVSRMEWRPVWRDGEFVPRRVLPLSLSYDHRVIDGAGAARFTGRLAGLLADLRRILL
jgi:pyruvate dehydrogenase E2 component (dihydrolipoamide acetyltransferase)